MSGITTPAMLSVVELLTGCGSLRWALCGQSGLTRVSLDGVGSVIFPTNCDKMVE
ncbi:putative lipoprotein [Mycobacterium xenopi 4042]|uniref:Putative lipoprotein n=1 Tax=Mycobacterium xenopi 4042 TaxID=1299334 RepID=X8BGQ5_MYCXE|nr:putative lipoprotein [Mycobacterium xenopi 3993]EUA42413.1 putative lipoprotein [Mycobacterium xenopi 4042]